MATTSIDQQFVEYIVKTLVNHPDKVKIDRTVDERGVLLSLDVDPEDVGRVIGRRGATAQSIRTLLRALGTKNEARYNLKIVNSDGYVPANREGDAEAGSMTADDSFTSTDDTEAASTEEAPVTEEAVETPAEEPVEKESKLAEKTRADLAELDDLDI